MFSFAKILKRRPSGGGDKNNALETLQDMSKEVPQISGTVSNIDQVLNANSTTRAQSQERQKERRGCGCF